MSLNISEQERLAKIEKLAENAKANMTDIMTKAYEQAVRDEDEDVAAELARKIRNKMLTESDKEVTLDRLNLIVPAGNSFTAWLAFLKDIAEMLTGEWAKYRQALRDLPEQEGFPLDIEFPKRPDIKLELEQKNDRN